MRTTSQPEGHLPSTPSASSSPSADLRRRRFLLALGAGSAATAAAATQAIASAPAEKPAGSAPETGRGYHETDHIRDYYASARL